MRDLNKAEKLASSAQEPPKAELHVENSSRCRHCDLVIIKTDYWRAPDGHYSCKNNNYKSHEPISGGASTGEQPPDKNALDEHARRVIASHQDRADRDLAKKLGVDVDEMRKAGVAARPSEPSAPKVELCLPEKVRELLERFRELDAVRLSPSAAEQEEMDEILAELLDAPTQATETASALAKCVKEGPDCDCTGRCKFDAAPSVAGTQPTEMYVCEIAHLILHPEQLYRFHIHPDCKGCRDYSGAAQGTPQVEEIAREIFVALEGESAKLAGPYCTYVPPEQYVAERMIKTAAAILRSHLVGALAQPGPEEKR